MPTWTVQADRRRADLDHLREHLRRLAETVDGLELQFVEPHILNNLRDAGKLRDFAPVASLSHADIRALEIATEEVLLEFGWAVDLSRTDELP